MSDRVFQQEHHTRKYQKYPISHVMEVSKRETGFETLSGHILFKLLSYLVATVGVEVIFYESRP